jgi:hypothetical protein
MRSIWSIISPNVKVGALALAMTRKGYALWGGKVSRLAYRTIYAVLSTSRLKE